MRAATLRVAAASVLAAAGAVGVLAGSEHAARAGAERTAKKAPAIVVRDARWLGFGKDKVGPGADRPDGTRDAHFRIVVAAPGGARQITGLVLWRCSPMECRGNSEKGGAPLAATPSVVELPSKVQWRPNRLGVFLGGKRLKIDARKQASWLRLPGSRSGIRLDLYVNDGPGCLKNPEAPAELSCHRRVEARFGPDLHFHVEVVSKAARAYSSWLALPGAVQKVKPAVALSGFRYLGLDRDVAGSTPSSAPDGRLDAHFDLDVTASTGPGYVWGISMGRAPVGGWSTIHDPGNALTAFLDGKRLDLALGPPEGSGWKTWADLPWSSTRHHLDLYAYDEGWGAFTPGSPFTVQVFVIVPSYVAGDPYGGAQTSLTLPAT